MANELETNDAGELYKSWEPPEEDVLSHIDELRRRQVTMTGSLDQHEAEIDALKRTVAHMLGLDSSRLKETLPNAKTNTRWFSLTARGGRPDKSYDKFTNCAALRLSGTSASVSRKRVFIGSDRTHLILSQPMFVVKRPAVVPANRVVLPLSGIFCLSTLGLAQEYSHVVLIHPFILIPSLVLLTGFTFVGLASVRQSRKGNNK
jgi:hypothetical protein